MNLCARLLGHSLGGSRDLVLRAALLRLAGLLGCLIVLAVGQIAQAADAPVRVLFVGGDWKAQLPNYLGKTPLRGHFVRAAVEKAAPGKFEFTLWTSYELLQYGEPDSLKKFDVIVVGDTMGQSVLPRLVEALDAFVSGGGGFLYCDNHKAFSFNTKELSFDCVLPIEVEPFRPFDEGLSQPIADDKPLKVSIAAVDHPTVRGLDWAQAPPLQAARYGKLKPGATVLAKSPSGKPIWVAWDKDRGRGAWLGGVFANDELSEQFATWSDFGKFYAQVLGWLGERSQYPRTKPESAVAGADLTIDFTTPGPELTSAHFGIHGQEDAPGGSTPMQGADLALYNELKLGGTFARTGIASPPGFVEHGPKGQFDLLDDGTNLDQFDPAKYTFKNTDIVLADIDRIHARPITLAWCPWFKPDWPEPKQYTKYFAAFLNHTNGRKDSADYRPRVEYFEVMNEPSLLPAAEVLPRYAEFFNYAADAIHEQYPGVKLGAGGFYEWSYFQQLLDRCPKLDWLSRHPYGHTGEAVFYLQDRFDEYAHGLGRDNLKFLITEWDFWIYGEPAFDYLMQRWKPLADHAENCVASLQYRWREYAEGGYVFGVHGEFDQPYGELPPDWPNPGKDKPITYRYNAFWLMRHCRGQQLAVDLQSPELRTSVSPRAYAIATRSGGRLNIVIYYGSPYEDLGKNRRYDSLKVHLQTVLPEQVPGRKLTIARADCRNTSEEPPRDLAGAALDLDLEIPSHSGVSITVE